MSSLENLAKYYKLQDDLLSDSTFVYSMLDHFGFENGRLILGSVGDFQKAVRTIPNTVNKMKLMRDPRMRWLFVERDVDSFVPLQRNDFMEYPRQPAFDKWKVAHCVYFRRTVSNFAEILEPLLAGEEKLWLIDQYFEPQKPGRDKLPDRFTRPFVNVLKHWIEWTPRLKLGSTGEVHIITSDMENWEKLNQWVELERAGSSIPDTVEIYPEYWEERFHNRFILSSRGGVMFPHGLDSDISGESTRSEFDVAVRLSREAWEKVRAYFRIVT